MLVDAQLKNRAARADRHLAAPRPIKSTADTGFGFSQAVQYDKRRTRQTLRFMLALSDFAAIATMFALASLLLDDLGWGFRTLATTLTVLLPIYFGIAANGNAYAMEAILDGWLSMRRSVAALFFAVCAVTLVAFFLKAGEDFSRLAFGCGAALSFPALIAGRYGVAKVGNHMLRGNPQVELIICDQVEMAEMEGHHIPIIQASDHGIFPDPRDPLCMQRLGQLVRNVDRVIVHCSPERRSDWAFLLHSLDIRADICVPEFDDIGAVSMGQLGSNRTLVISAGPATLESRAIKRAFDLLMVLSALPLLSIPMLIVAIAIKLESPGPVFFRQIRIGLGNRPFYIFKFRSMRVESSDASGTRSAARDDDRITRVGRFIRRTSIDELPQLFNVLRGEMSIVGPRPHAIGSLAGDKLFWEVDHRYWLRHSLKPGLTGLAQVRGFRGATDTEDDLADRLQADLEYLDGWTIWRDLKIIANTARVLVHDRAF